MQTSFNFDVHVCESNRESESYLEAGRQQFGKNCQILFDAFMRGDIINNLNSPVSEFRRRRQDLTDDNGVHISLHSADGRMKNWHMTEEDKKFNQKFIK